MKIAHLAACAAAALALGAHAQTPGKTASASFVDGEGNGIGSAKLTQTPGGVLIAAELTGLPPGEHGFHIHQTGRCDPKDGFKSANGHFAPRKRPHGYYGAKGHHAGDMPNQFVSQDGRLRAHVHNTAVRLDAKSLLDKDGSALVVHSKPDDYRSQPSGDAGDRIACAVIETTG